MNTENQEIVVRLENVEKRYRSGEKEFRALAGVNLSVRKGEFLAVVGKSGSGKSTLLNMLGGIDRPTAGKITVGGSEIGTMKENRLSRFRGENIGIVFQFFQLMPTLTVLENVVMPMDFTKKIPASKRKERALMLLNRVGVAEHSSKFPSALSGGEQQRVAIARALANDPEIILADEPTGNLDSQTADSVFELLEALTREGRNIIMVTHNEELAAKCGRIIRLRDGAITEDIMAGNRGN